MNNNIISVAYEKGIVVVNTSARLTDANTYHKLKKSHFVSQILVVS